jgi:tetratricopeptide (TPR) repeat protein
MTIAAALLTLSIAVPGAAGLQPGARVPASQAGGPGAQRPHAGILVVPFEAPPGDARAYWLGDGAAVLVANDINARGLGAITRPIRERAYEQLQLPAGAVLSRATVIKVGELVGASRVVVGEVSLEGDTLTVRARAIRIDVGRADEEAVERGPLTDFLSIIEKVARRVVPGGTVPGTTRAPSLQAFERYMKGLLAEQPASQAEFLEAALTIDPAFHRARLALWEVRTAQGDHAAALAAARAVDAAAPEARRARFLSGVSLMALKQNDEAFALLKGMQQEGAAPAVLNNLGIVQMRRGAPADGKPAYFLTRAAESAPNDPDVLFNLGYAYAVDRDPQAAIYWLREALRRNPADAEAHLVLAFALDASGGAVEAARERELAAQLSAEYAAAPPKELPKGLERVAEDLEPLRGQPVDQALLDTAQRDQRDAARFHLDRGRRLYEKEQDRDAMAELRRAVFLSPYEAEAHLFIGRIHLRAGRPRDAVDALKISIWSRDTVPARITLAEAYLRLEDLPSARTHVQKALELDPDSAEAKSMLARIDGGGG